MRSPLSLCILYPTDAFAQFLSPFLEEATRLGKTAQPIRYICEFVPSSEALLKYVQQPVHPIDCLILPVFPGLQALFERLQQQALFFPTVVIEAAVPSDPASEPEKPFTQPPFSYHPAVMSLTVAQISQLSLTIEQSISKFLQLNPDEPSNSNLMVLPPSPTHRLMAQQLRLAEKLKERLDYLGVYYKRNPRNFLRHMTPSQKEELLQQLSVDYRAIVLAYFTDEPGLNDKIDQFVNVAFFADVPIAQVVAIHMDLMDEFSKHLKLEGRSDEVLLDYRLTLIDTLAHLCEMYRRSIPRES